MLNTRNLLAIRDDIEDISHADKNKARPPHNSQNGKLQ